MSADDPTDPPVTPAPPPPPPVAPAPAHPFAPVAREPWVNPAKRAPLILAAVLAALVLCGASFVIGIAVGHHRHGDRTGIYMRPGPYGGQLGGRPGIIRPNRFPGGRNLVPPRPAQLPTSVPTPGATHS